MLLRSSRHCQLRCEAAGRKGSPKVRRTVAATTCAVGKECNHACCRDNVRDVIVLAARRTVNP